MGDRSTVVVSYCKADTRWKERLVKHLAVLERRGLLNLWDDSRVSAGDDRIGELELAMNHARAAILVVSAAYLSCDRILGEEVPRLLKRREEGGLRIIPILAEPCDWEPVDWLAAMLRPDERALSGCSEHEANIALSEVAKEVRRSLGGRAAHLSMVARDAAGDPKAALSFVGAITSTVIVVQLSGGSVLVLFAAVGLAIVLVGFAWAALIVTAVAKGGLGAAVGLGATQALKGAAVIVALGGGAGLAGAELAAIALGEPEHRPTSHILRNGSELKSGGSSAPPEPSVGAAPGARVLPVTSGTPAVSQSSEPMAIPEPTSSVKVPLVVSSTPRQEPPPTPPPLVTTDFPP